MLEKIAKYAPESMKRNSICCQIYDSINSFNPKKTIYLSCNYRKLKKFKDIHLGQRCFVIGNGPSINEMDLSKLKGEVTIGCNRIYLNDRITPSYYCLEDRLLLSQIASELEGWNAADTVKFIPIYLKEYSKKINNVYLVNFVIKSYWGSNPEFSDNFAKIGYWGSTVTYMMLQIAYFLGCNPIYLVGIDGVRANKPKHFYTKDDVKDNLARYALSDAAFIKAGEFLESKGVEIYDATLDPLKPFYNWVKYEAIFK